MSINVPDNFKKPKLVILSDLWGKEDSEWISYYTVILEKYFEIKFYDSCKIADIDITDYKEEKLHRQFVNDGIDKAVTYMLKLEEDILAILGFSVGGSIAWKACLSGLQTQHLFALSSTRLRYETQKPLNATQLFYGEKDAFRPSSNWFEHFKFEENIFKDETHDMYKKKTIAQHICGLIINQLLTKNNRF